jgi:hypothetical protein
MKSFSDEEIIKGYLQTVANVTSHGREKYVISDVSLSGFATAGRLEEHSDSIKQR